MGDEALKELLAELRRQIDISDILPVAVECWADALESALSELAKHRRTFPIQRFGNVPWHIGERAYEKYADKFGTDQSLERLAERGGFAISEMDEFYSTWRDELSENVRLKSELARLRVLRDHGRYLADAAEYYLNVMSDEDPEPDEPADSYRALRSCVYEFRKRFAQTSPVQSHEEKQG